MIKYRIIPPDGAEVFGYINEAREFHDVVNPALHAQRPGSSLEHVSVLYNEKRASMFVDEDGVRHGQAFNRRATEVYHAASKARGQDMRGAPLIYGVAILFDANVWF